MSAADPGAVRRARARDRDALVALWMALTEHHASFDPLFALRPDAEAEIRRLVGAQLRDPDSALYVAEQAGAIVGFCGVRVDQAPPVHEEILRSEVTDLFVAADARRRGLGRALLRAGLDWARSQGTDRVEVRVSPRNAEGQAFWRSSGFAEFMDVLHRRL